jgi:hypothetical protein
VCTEICTRVRCYAGHLDHVITKEGDKDKDQSFVHVRRRPAHVQCYAGHMCTVLCHLDHVITKEVIKDKDQSFAHVRRRPAHVQCYAGHMCTVLCRASRPCYYKRW